MARKKKKMALYEVFSRGLANSRRSKSLEALHPVDTDQAKQPGSGTTVRPIRPLPTRPRMFQVNRGRVEISMPTQFAVAVLLAIAVVVLGAYRLGQWQALDNTVGIPAETSDVESPLSVDDVEPPADTAGTDTITDTTAVKTVSTGSNWIVIATHKNRDQLIPVQAFFAGYGVETQIRSNGSMFILHTENTYDNPARVGTEGYNTKQKIIKIGGDYKPPPGYGKFDFSSVYGMKSLE